MAASSSSVFTMVRGVSSSALGDWGSTGTCSYDYSPLSVAIMRPPDTITRASLEFLQKSRRHLATPLDSSGRIQP
ncbi:hypothetical protein E2C01_050081 [Portunus trituberculatus]|uniref:Uncharacterized protein n=1 Tax=Portunus trituberculatus TaxID=210409 RepID=A0A5B7GGB1_PORTR|nr:hypothetical protein [Portunus trituberculatus]